MKIVTSMKSTCLMNMCAIDMRQTGIDLYVSLVQEIFTDMFAFYP